MAFKTQPIGELKVAIDWSGVAELAATELGAAEYRVSYLYGSSRPSQALNPLAIQRALYAFEKLGVGGALPVLSFFGTRKTWTEASETVIRVLGYEPNEDWVSVLDENDNPIRVIAHNGSKLCFAINVYSPDLSAIESRDMGGGSAESSDANQDSGNGEAADADDDGCDVELDFEDSN